MSKTGDLIYSLSGTRLDPRGRERMEVINVKPVLKNKGGVAEEQGR